MKSKIDFVKEKRLRACCSEISMLLFFLYHIVIRIPLAMILVHCSLGLNGIWVAILTSHVLAALIAGIFERTIVKEN